MSVGVFLPSLTPAQALLGGPKIKVPSASDMASDIERRYHLNTESVQTQGETLNVTDNKKMTPQVSLFFSPSDPKEGEKINAQAFPIYFISEPKHMYYTWYLQRKGCEKRNGSLNTDALRSCDLDGNGRIDEEDWKIEAARIIANGGFDANFANYDTSPGADPDADGYTARFGGDNRVNTAEYCYYHDTQTGENYEIVGDASDPDFGCGSLQPVCMEETVEVSPGTGNTSSSSLAEGLSLYYRFDDGQGTTAVDSSSSSFDGTFVDGPIWSTSGQINGSLDFDGSNDAVEAGDILNIDDGDNFTIAGWFNRDTATTDDVLVAKRNGTDVSDVGYIVYIDDATDRLVAEISDGTNEYELQSSTTFTSTGWHHFALVWNDVAEADTSLFIDGSAESGTTTGTFSSVGDISNTLEYTVGAESDGGNPFDGRLDEHRFYSRILSSAEVTALDALTAPTESSFNTSAGTSTVTGFPYCSRSGIATCVTGTPCCVSNPATATTCTQDITGGSCSVATIGSSDPACKHLFPRSGVDASGNGSFKTEEEEFWETDPRDPDTADNGNKDEANVIGLGRENFAWNYVKGDKVGVVVEGTSMITTKYEDATNMIMWAFSKNDCDAAGNKGSLQKTIKGYEVVIPTIEIDLNDCLEANLVDPLEGGQATKMEVTLQATPDDPVNDSSDRASGDTIQVSASVNNAVQSIQNVYFDWKVDISTNGTINPSAASGGWRNITSQLNTVAGDKKLLTPVKGNGVDRVRLTLNLKNNDQLDSRPFSSYLSNGIGYLRFRAEVAENFNAAGNNRRGKGDIIVKFVSTADRIAAYIVEASGSPALLTRTQNEICSGVPTFSGNETAEQRTEKTILSRLDTKLCRVVKNEIIGLRVDSTTAGSLSNYNWSINGLPLVCNRKVSFSCFDSEQGDTNFFPIIGNVGDVFTVTVTANKVEHDSSFPQNTTSTNLSTQKAITLSRSFKIVEPEVSIESADENTAWPKVLGRYTDPTGGQPYVDFSKTTLQAFSGSQVKLQARFTPEFLGSYTMPQVERAWTVDGERVGDGSSNLITFSTLKPAESIYNIGLDVVYRPKASIRQALQDIWQISSLDSTEQYFSTASQLEHPPEAALAQTGVNRYLALLSSYLPASLLFSIRVLLSIGLILFVTGFLFALIPNTPSQTKRFSR